LAIVNERSVPNKVLTPNNRGLGVRQQEVGKEDVVPVADEAEERDQHGHHAGRPADRVRQTPIDTHSDIVYARPAAGGKTVELKMDILVPKIDGKKPLVVYLSGGGFQMAPKEAGLDQRTYVAEAGYVVASIQYRTIADGAIYRDGVDAAAVPASVVVEGSVAWPAGQA
jgi:acetyl esterase/lipase